MFFKREKNVHISPVVILEKYDTDPAHQNISSSYDRELHTPLVLTKYLNQDIEFLEAILEANKGRLKEDSKLYKEVTRSVQFADYDLGSAQNNFHATQLKQKKNKKDVNFNSEQNAAKSALEECQKRYNRMESLKNFLDELEEGSLAKKTCHELKANIKYLKNISAEIIDLTKQASVIHQKYIELWGENKENIETKLESKGQKIDKKEIKQYGKIMSYLNNIYNNLPVQHQFLDELLHSLESIQNQPSQT